jgi:hypothetical protein
MSPCRQILRSLVIASVSLTAVATFTGLVLAATHLWECNYCHQQYQGDQPPAFAKCPAKVFKQNHWWIKKS